VRAEELCPFFIGATKNDTVTTINLRRIVHAARAGRPIDATVLWFSLTPLSPTTTEEMSVCMPLACLWKTFPCKQHRVENVNILPDVQHLLNAEKSNRATRNSSEDIALSPRVIDACSTAGSSADTSRHVVDRTHVFT